MGWSGAGSFGEMAHVHTVQAEDRVSFIGVRIIGVCKGGVDILLRIEIGKAYIFPPSRNLPFLAKPCVCRWLGSKKLFAIFKGFNKNYRDGQLIFLFIYLLSEGGLVPLNELKYLQLQ